jgi:hypothetical protein
MVSSTRSFTSSRNELGEVAGDFDKLTPPLGGGAFDADTPGGAVGFFRGESIFGFQVIRSLNGHRPQGHDLRAHHDPDGFASRSLLQPLTQVLSGSGNRKRLHSDIILSLQR